MKKKGLFAAFFALTLCLSACATAGGTVGGAVTAEIIANEDFRRRNLTTFTRLRCIVNLFKRAYE